MYCRFSKKNKLSIFCLCFIYIETTRELKPKIFFLLIICCSPTIFYVLPLNFFTFFVCGRSLGQVFFCFFIWTWDIKVFHFPPRGRISGIYRIFNTNDLIKIILYYNNGRLVWFFLISCVSSVWFGIFGSFDHTLCEFFLVYGFQKLFHIVFTFFFYHLHCVGYFQN